MNGLGQVNLTKIVYDIVHEEPSGRKHAEVVREILRRGYVNQGPLSLSATVHGILAELVTSGVIHRKENECMERRYTAHDDSPPCYQGKGRCPYPDCSHKLNQQPLAEAV